MKTDKSTVSVSGDFLKEMTSILPNEHQEEAYAIFQKWMTERMKELNLVMDEFKLAISNSTYEYERIADADRFIVAGHSLGGSAAYAMARTRDAVTNLTLLNKDCMEFLTSLE